MRNVGAVAAGIVLGIVIVFSVETISSKIYPLPPGIDATNKDAMRLYMPHIPRGALLLVLSGWILGTFLGAWTAARLARRALQGVVVAVVLLAGGVANMMMIPHPPWFWVASILAFLIGGYAGSRLGGAQPASGPDATPA